MPDTPPAGEAVPLSRRAAREAAARQTATGSTPTAPGATAPDAAAPASDAPPTGEGFQPVPMRTPRPTQPIDIDLTPADDDTWVFANAGAAPAMPYSRTGTGATPTAAAAPSAPRGGSAHRDADSSPRSSGASLDDLFSGSTSTDDIGDVPAQKSKKRRRTGRWIALGVVLLVLGGIAGGAYYVWTTYESQIRELMGWEEPKDYEEGMATGEATVTIEPGFTGQPISQALYDAGVTKTPEAFYDYLIDSGQNPNFQPGVYQLQQKMTSAAALDALMDPANKLEYTAQIPEGFTVEGTLERVAEGTSIPLEELQAAAANPAAYGVPADSLEGWLFPATYTFDPSVTAESAIQTLVNRTVEALDAAGVPVEDRQHILTIASIIQREARITEDFYKVSRVIQNRLDAGMQLQMDSTAQYGYGEMHDGTVSSSGEALADENPWNTYVIPGLPAGPISNPGDAAIDAAMHPAEGPWLFFVTWNMDTGETIFSETDAEHEEAKQKWFDWCEQNDNRGC